MYVSTNEITKSQKNKGKERRDPPTPPFADAMKGGVGKNSGGVHSPAPSPSSVPPSSTLLSFSRGSGSVPASRRNDD